MRRLAMIAILTGAPLAAQWLDYPWPGIPRTPDGKPNLSAPAPRTPDGKPDLTGLYATDGGGLFQNIAAGMKPENLPILPWAAAVAREREEQARKDDPYSHCLPPIVPRINSANHPFKIVQTPPLVIILYETSFVFRQVFLDGRPLPKDPQPTWLGYSVGKWDGDTLVVETSGFRDQGWLDGDKGHPQTDALHVTERFRRPTFGRLEVEATITDPKAYSKPFTVTQRLKLLADSEIIENICENERDAVHLVGK